MKSRVLGRHKSDKGVFVGFDTMLVEIGWYSDGFPFNYKKIVKEPIRECTFSHRYMLNSSIITPNHSCKWFSGWINWCPNLSDDWSIFLLRDMSLLQKFSFWALLTPCLCGLACQSAFHHVALRQQWLYLPSKW